jgi:hypothetical protein
VIDHRLCRFKGIALAPIGTCEPSAHLDRGCERRLMVYPIQTQTAPIRLTSPGISTAHWQKRCLSKCVCMRASMHHWRRGQGSSSILHYCHIAANGSRSMSRHSRNNKRGVRRDIGIRNSLWTLGVSQFPDHIDDNPLAGFRDIDPQPGILDAGFGIVPSPAMYPGIYAACPGEAHDHQRALQILAED